MPSSPHYPMNSDERWAYEEVQKLVDCCSRRRALESSQVVTEARFKELSPLIGVSQDQKTFYCQNTLLSLLPPEIGQLEKLEALYLHNNKLIAIPPEIGALTILKKLFLSRNLLSRLPPEIGKLTLLTHLFIHTNRLEALPSQIGELKLLEHLRLEWNRLTELPPEIDRLTALESLYLHGNDALGISKEMLGPEWTPTLPGKILGHYFALLTAASKNTTPTTIVNNDNKIIFGGDNLGTFAHTMENCTNIIEQQVPGERTELLRKLQQQVKQLIDALPVEKQNEAPQIGEHLQRLVKEATSAKPNPAYYCVSFKGLRDAATWVKDMAVPITATILALEKLL